MDSGAAAGGGAGGAAAAAAAAGAAAEGTTAVGGIEEVVQANCTLVAGNFDKFIQFLLACLSLGVLVVKRCREHPPRPLAVWFLDTSKQCFGAGAAHLANLFIAIYLAKGGASDECAVYFLNFFLDTTVGVFISYLLLQFLQRLARSCGGTCMTALMRSGWYGDAPSGPSLAIWAAQLLSWLVITFVTKLVIAVLILAAWAPLNATALAIFSVFQHHRKVELVLVMIVGPTVLNAVQFWIQDNFLADETGRLAASAERLPFAKMDGVSPRLPTTTNGHAASLPPATRRRPSLSVPAGNGAGSSGSSTAASAASAVLSSIGIGLGGVAGSGSADGQKRVD